MKILRYVPILMLVCGFIYLFLIRFHRPNPTRLRNGETLLLHEGLPHQTWERTALEKELKKSHDIILGHAFYSRKPPLNVSDAESLAALLNDSDTFDTYHGPKACGGFHPDFAVEFVAQKRTYLLCFGCHEVIVLHDSTEQIYDLSKEAHEKLKALLSNYRLSRPSRHLDP
jgi:hypothetical protein